MVPLVDCTKFPGKEFYNYIEFPTKLKRRGNLASQSRKPVFSKHNTMSNKFNVRQDMYKLAFTHECRYRIS